MHVFRAGAKPPLLKLGKISHFIPTLGRRRRQIYIRPNPPTLSFVYSRRFVVVVSAIATFFLARFPLDATLSSRAHSAHPPGISRDSRSLLVMCQGMDLHSRVTQAERTVGALRFFLYIRFFLNAPLDLLLDPLTLSGSLVLHFTVVGTSESLLCFQPATLHF